MSTATLIRDLKDANQDFEFYPSTSEIIGVVARDVISKHYSRDCRISFLDIGAGDGRVLTKIKECVGRATKSIVDMYAIEISNIHLNNMPKDVVVIGTDFMEQSMIDKPLDIAFSNPPYSEFESWAVKLIREAAVRTLYLVIPKRWENSDDIRAAIKSRSTKADVLGEFDFLDADRKARAIVNVIRLEFEKDSSFDAAIERMLPELAEFDKLEGEAEIPQDDPIAREAIESSGSLIESLVMAYDSEIQSLIQTYRDAVKIHPKLLAEFGVSKQSILIGLRGKIKGLKDKYWNTLFGHFKPITKRMATKQRKAFLESLAGKSSIDFTEGNVYAMLIWITKWSNEHFDTQLIDLFKSMSEFCNVVNYKSNERVWSKSNWRYSHQPRAMEDDVSRYKLEYRIVLERAGGISTSRYIWEAKNGLKVSAFEYLQDVITVANNLGFECEDCPSNYEWQSNKQNIFKLSDGKPLVAVRAFKNGNLHLHFSPIVMLAINVEAGRLLGWIRNPEQAAEEMKATKEEINQVFGASLKIGQNYLLKIGKI